MIAGKVASSSRLALRDLVAGRGLHVESVHLGLAVHQVLNYVADLGVILVAVPFGILSCLPEAQSQYAFRVRHEHNFIHKTCLRLQRRQYLLMQHAANLSGISW